MKTLEKRLEELSPKEREAYEKYVASGKPPLAASTANDMFSLYLQGYNISEIAALNPAFGLGIIVRAKVDGNWDDRRAEHIEQVYSDIRGVVQRTQLDAIRFLATGMAAYQKMAGAKLQKYLQTGDESVLGDMKEISFSQYQKFADMLLRLTGQGDGKKGSEILVKHEVVNQGAAPTINRPLTAGEATELLRTINVTPVKK